MSKKMLTLLSLLCTLVMCATAASAALAVEIPVWHVNGKTLKSEEKREVKIKGTKPYVLKGKLAGVNVTIECTTQGEEGKAFILGGEPGTDTGTDVLSSCKTSIAECAVVKGNIIITNNNKFALAVGAKPKKIYDVVRGKEGKLTEFELKGGSCGTGTKVTATGSIAAEVAPQEKEGEALKLVFPATPVTEIENSKGETEKVGLTLAGSAATLQGESEAVLVSKEVFGAFS